MKLIRHGGCKRGSYKELSSHILFNPCSTFHCNFVTDTYPQCFSRSDAPTWPCSCSLELYAMQSFSPRFGMSRMDPFPIAIAQSRYTRSRHARKFLSTTSMPSIAAADKDILRNRVLVKTTGITETAFRVGDLAYKSFDIGGQWSEQNGLTFRCIYWDEAKIIWCNCDIRFTDLFSSVLVAFKSYRGRGNAG